MAGDDRSVNVSARDHRIATQRGTLFARSWLPLDAAHGTRPAILLLHDSVGCVELWRDFPEQLAVATGRTVVAYDRLGFGRSDAHPDRLRPDFMHDEAVTSVPRLCETLELESLVPFGHSVGGAMAVATAVAFPARCTAVVTESAQAFVEDRTLAGIEAARVAFRQLGQLERLARYHGDKARWVLDAWIETWLDPAFAHWSLDDELGRLRCPILAIHGDRDEYGSLRHLERISVGTRGVARTVALEDCGHVPHREQPRRVLEEITAFLR